MKHILTFLLLLLISCDSDDPKPKVFDSLEGEWEVTNWNYSSNFIIEDIGGVMTVTSGTYTISSDDFEVMENVAVTDDLGSITLKQDEDNYLIYKDLTLETNSSNYDKLYCSDIEYSKNGNVIITTTGRITLKHL